MLVSRGNAPPVKLLINHLLAMLLALLACIRVVEVGFVSADDVAGVGSCVGHL